MQLNETITLCCDKMPPAGRKESGGGCPDEEIRGETVLNYCLKITLFCLMNLALICARITDTALLEAQGSIPGGLMKMLL